MKTILKLLIPKFIFIIKELLQGEVGRVKMCFLRLPTAQLLEEKIIIVGNGPSLKISYDKYLDVLQRNPCLVVNNFVNSAYFEKIAPKYYLLADPSYFKEISKLSERLKKVVGNLIEGLKEKVNWSMVLIVPLTARNSEFYRTVKTNSNIRFMFYNNQGGTYGFPNCGVKFALWNYGILSPLAQTVLNTAISLSVSSKVHDIFIIGADTSWHENYELDQQTNQLYCKDTHFYGNAKFPIYEDAEHCVSQKIHNELRMASIALESYWTLKAYAIYNHVNIYNASSYSWIDAFTRKQLNNI